MNSIGDIVATHHGKQGAQTLVRIIDQIRKRKINPTFFLLISMGFGHRIGPTVGCKARKHIFNKVSDTAFSYKLMPSLPSLSINWMCFNEHTSVLFYTDSPYDEKYVHALTKLLLLEAFESMLKACNITREDIRIDFIVTKNINHAIDLQKKEHKYHGEIGDSEHHLALEDELDALEIEHNADGYDSSADSTSSAKKRKKVGRKSRKINTEGAYDSDGRSIEY